MALGTRLAMETEEYLNVLLSVVDGILSSNDQFLLGAIKKTNQVEYKNQHKWQNQQNLQPLWGEAVGQEPANRSGLEKTT